MSDIGDIDMLVLIGERRGIEKRRDSHIFSMGLTSIVMYTCLVWYCHSERQMYVILVRSVLKIRENLKSTSKIRDLISGAEFQIRDDELEDEEDENVNKFNHYPDEIDIKYHNYEALELDADDDGVISFSLLRPKMIDLTADGKVKKLVKQNGYGDLVPPNAVVYIHYNAHHDLEAKPFDNSYLRRKNPERHRLGDGNLIYGLEVGIQTMRRGERSQFLFEPEYAFGKRGCAPRIPPSATVLFEVELINFVDCLKDSVTENIENEDKNSYVFAEKLAKQNHILGNDCFKQKNEKAAIKRYEKAVNRLLNCHLLNAEEEVRQKHLLLKLYSNLCVCYNKIGRPKAVCKYAQEAMYIDVQNAKNNVKLHFNWGLALISLMDYSTAAAKLRAANKLEPNNPKIKEALSTLDKKKTQFDMEEKIYFKKALGVIPVNGTNTEPTVSENETIDLIGQELKKMLLEKIEVAKKGETVKLTLAYEVADKVEELCNDLITDDLSVERSDGSLVISKVQKI